MKTSRQFLTDNATALSVYAAWELLFFGSLYFPFTHPDVWHHALVQWMINFDWHVSHFAPTPLCILSIWVMNTAVISVEWTMFFLAVQPRPFLQIADCLQCRQSVTHDSIKYGKKWVVLIWSVATFCYFGLWLVVAGRILSIPNVPWQVFLASIPHGGLEYGAYALPFGLIKKPRVSIRQMIHTALLGEIFLIISAGSEVILAPHVGVWLHIVPATF